MSDCCCVLRETKYSVVMEKTQTNPKSRVAATLFALTALFVLVAMAGTSAAALKCGGTRTPAGNSAKSGSNG